MSKTNINKEIIELFQAIDKKEKKSKEEGNKYEENEKYKKVNKLIKDFVEKKNDKKINSENIDLTKDIIESLKILNTAYENNSKNENFNKFLSEKEKMINKYLEKYHIRKKEEEKNKNKDISEDDEFENYESEIVNDFEIITTPALSLIIDESKKIEQILNENKIKEENIKINELINDISNVLVIANKLMNNKKLIDDVAIKRLHEEIKTIKKEYDKIYKKKKYMEIYSKSKI
jgi:hypothetical protein